MYVYHEPLKINSVYRDSTDEAVVNGMNAVGVCCACMFTNHPFLLGALVRQNSLYLWTIFPRT